MSGTRAVPGRYPGGTRAVPEAGLQNVTKRGILLEGTDAVYPGGTVPVAGPQNDVKRGILREAGRHPVWLLKI